MLTQDSKPLFKTTIVIWSEEDPQGHELVDADREATDGSMYCSKMSTKRLKNPTKDPDWDGTEFFNDGT